MIAKLIASLLTCQTKGRMVGGGSLWSDIRRGQRTFQLHTRLRIRVFSVFERSCRVGRVSDVDGRGGWWWHAVVWHVPGVRHVHLRAVRWRRRWILV